MSRPSFSPWRRSQRAPERGASAAAPTCDPSRDQRSRRCSAGLALWIAAALLAVGCGGDVETRMAEVRALQDVGQFTASIDELREILAIQPDYPEATYRLGVALMQTGEPSRAIWALQKASESEEYAIPAGILLATAHFGNQDYEEALRAADRVLQLDPDRNVALQLRAKANIGAKRADDALADTTRLVELYPDDYAVAVLHATALIDAGHLEEARVAHQRVKEMGAASGDFETEGRACLSPAIFARDQLHDQASAEAYFAECVEKYPTHAFVVTQATRFYDDIGKEGRATEVIRVAVEKAPESLSLRSSLANRLRRQGHNEEAEAVLVEAAETFNSAAAWNLLSGFYREIDEPEKALPAIEKVIELSRGGNDQLRFTRADLLIDVGRLDEAQQVANTLEEPTYAKLIRGRIQLERGEAALALRNFDEGIRNWPNNGPARFLAAQAALALGDHERAISELREAVRADKEATDAALVLGRIYFERGEYNKALNFLNGHTKNRPDSQVEKAYVLAVRSFTELGEYDRARSTIDLLEKVPGQRLSALIERASVATRESGPAAGVATIEEAQLDLTDAANAEVLRSLAANLEAAGRTEDALARVDAALAANPDTASIHEMRGSLLARLGRKDEARAAFEKSVELDPDHAAAYAGLAILAADSAQSPMDLKRSIELFDRAAGLAPNVSEYAYSAAQLSLAIQADDAESRLEEIVRRFPGHAPSRNDLAWLLAEEDRDLERAVELAQQAKTLDPSADVLDTLGWVLLKQGDASAAVAALQDAYAARSDSPTIRYHLGKALIQAGQAQSGREHIQRALEAGAFPEAEEARQELARLEQS